MTRQPPPDHEPIDALSRAVRRRERGETWTDEQFRAAREHDLSERRHPVRSVVLAVLGCLLLSALLTSDKLLEIAERQEFEQPETGRSRSPKGLIGLPTFGLSTARTTRSRSATPTTTVARLSRHPPRRSRPRPLRRPRQLRWPALRPRSPPRRRQARRRPCPPTEESPVRIRYGCM